jgi:hypothetical protein
VGNSTPLVAEPKARHRCRVMSARTAGSLGLPARSRGRAAVGVLVSVVSALGGCGSRTGLELDEVVKAPPEGPDAAPPAVDAGPDVTEPPDAELHVSPPSMPAACVQLPEPSIYLVTLGANLWQFRPPSGGAPVLSEQGHLNCPISPSQYAFQCTDGVPTPFSMAVDRAGTAYVVYCDGEVFKVDTQKLTCAATGLVVPIGFGMAFSQDTTDADETLFVAEGPNQETLASINTTTLAIKEIGDFSPTATSSELTGTGAGDLFVFYVNNGSEMSIARVDKTTAVLTSILPLPGLEMGKGWAFVFWGGDFYTFTGQVNTSNPLSTVITRISPVDGSQSTVGAISDLVVGAGVSTCAPQQ